MLRCSSIWTPVWSVTLTAPGPLSLLRSTVLERWHASLAEVEVQSGFFCSVTLITAAGHKR